MSRRMMIASVVEPPSTTAFYRELESGVVGSEFDILSDAGASNGSYVRNNVSNTNAPTTAASYVEITIDNVSAGTYNLWVRCRVVDGTTDSFFQQVDSGSWAAVNGISTQITPNTWAWVNVWINTNYTNIQTFTLAAGSHTVRIGRRELMDIDKIYLTQNGDTPV